MMKDMISNPSINGLIEKASKKRGQIVASSFLLACLINKDQISIFDQTNFNKKSFNLAKSDEQVWVE